MLPLPALSADLFSTMLERHGLRCLTQRNPVVTTFAHAQQGESREQPPRSCHGAPATAFGPRQYTCFAESRTGVVAPHPFTGLVTGLGEILWTLQSGNY
ncbi:MAG: hypothetical protein ACREOO_27655 [bacterium]